MAVSTPARRRSWMGAVVAVVLVASACGGEGGDGGEQSSRSVTTTAAATDSTGSDGGTGSLDLPTTTSGDRKLEPPEYFFTGDAEGAGQTIEPACAEEVPNQPAQPLFSYLVPDGWKQVAGSSLNGGEWSASGQRDFDPGTGASADRIAVEVDYDDERDDEGQLEDPDDYGLNGDGPDVGPFEPTGTVEVDGTEVELIGFDNADKTFLRTRLVFAEAPSALLRENPRVEYSAVVSVEYGTEAAPIDQAAAKDIITSMRLADCSQEAVTTELEQVLRADFSE